MNKKVRDRIQDFFLGNEGVRKVADDPLVTAELVMLLRIVMADGKIRDSELVGFQKICEKAFGIAPEDFPEVMSFLEDFAFETTGKQALEMFKDHSEERKRELLANMAALARADDEMHGHERLILQRAASYLGIIGDGEA